jgi:molybdopterin-guanine dinucleotide biosynthesis protein B
MGKNNQQNQSLNMIWGESPPVVSVVGHSGSGKTTLLEKLISGLKDRGYSVGTIKHDVHGFEMDRPGKDSWRHKKAGASGYKKENLPKLEVFRSQIHKAPLFKGDKTLLALISEDPIDLGVPRFSIGDDQRVVDFLIEYFNLEKAVSLACTKAAS